MKILFMCVANSARSQLAEALAEQVLGPNADIRSAGSQPTKLNPFAVRVLIEAGADVSNLWSKAVQDLPKEFVSGLDYVITLCAEEVCPVIISTAKRLHWPLPDPAGLEGGDEVQLTRFRATRDEIRNRLEVFASDIG